MEEQKVIDWSQARKIFEDVLQKPADDRMTFAKALCGTDESLLQEVTSLLDWHESSESFLETPAVAHIVDNKNVPDLLIPGQKLLHYEIRELIGKGGMGEVYSARDTKLHRNVAIKLLRRDLAPKARASDRLLREARAAALLEHPNICHIHEISEADGVSFIVMQYVAGTTLDELLVTGRIDIERALDIGLQIAAGLAEAHSRGIIHRDIKPANIIVTDKKQVKILDFGLAKFIEAESSTDAANRMESTGGVMGTIPYMSPEQLNGRAADARSDIFSFGSLLFEMISGASAFRRERDEDTIAAILTETPDWSVVPPFLRPLLTRCLEKDPANRYPSAVRVVDALSAARKAKQSEGEVPGRPSNSKGKASAAVRAEAKTASYKIPDTRVLDFRKTEESDSTTWVSDVANGSNDPTVEHLPNGNVKNVGRQRLPRYKTFLTGVFIAVLMSTGLWGYYLYAPSQTVIGEPADSKGPSRKLYWELSFSERRSFIRNGVAQIQTLIGDVPRAISDDSLNLILNEVEKYVSRRDSLSQEPLKDGLRTVYGRASQYVPMVSAEFKRKNVPPAIGIYQAVIESEYRDCLKSDTGPIGIFQFSKGTAQKYGLDPNDRCRVDLSAKAAAAYISHLLSFFGGESSSRTLAVLSFNQGEELTTIQLRKLNELGLNERNYWVISENRDRFSFYNASTDEYVSRFFAAAIIGENPEVFDLVTPSLSTIKTRADLIVQSDLVAIPGGTFNMGRNDSVQENEKPEHAVAVDEFRMSKTEVTNIEFYEFISATGYGSDLFKANFLAHWVYGRPMDFDENTPVRYVNIEDINAFIKWKSQKDGVEYRLPTEQEWEYAARNGSNDNLYPWGDEFMARCSVLDREYNEPVAVGTRSCPNAWGIHDLIGNVFEWTSTTLNLYPGNPGEVVNKSEPHYMVRGGSARQRSTGSNAITSTFRIAIPASRRSAELGFRLAASP